MKWFSDFFLKNRKATKMLSEVTPDNLEEKLEEWQKELVQRILLNSKPPYVRNMVGND